MRPRAFIRREVGRIRKMSLEQGKGFMSSVENVAPSKYKFYIDPLEAMGKAKVNKREAYEINFIRIFVTQLPLTREESRRVDEDRSRDGTTPSPQGISSKGQ